MAAHAAGAQGPARPPLHRRRWFRVALWLHRWSGLVATPFFLILCVTGSILIFHGEVDRLLGDVPPPAAAPRAPLGLAALAEAGRAQAGRRPGETAAVVPRYVALLPDEPDRAAVGVSTPDRSKLEATHSVLVSRADGRALAATDPEATLTGKLLDLHARWFLGIPGELLGSLVAILVLVALGTGVLVHAPYVRRRAFGVVRRGRGARLSQLDWHNFVGVVVLGWVTVVAVTGICLGLGTIALFVWQASELPEMAGRVTAGAPSAGPPSAAVAPATFVSLDQAAAAARAAQPDRDLQFAVFPGTDFSSPRHYTFLMYGRQPYNERLFDVVLVDAVTGRLKAARPLPRYLQAVVLSGPLHFGDYGGLPLKLLWLASTWGALFITGNGAWLWWAKRRGTRPASLRPAAAALPAGSPTAGVRVSV